LTPVTHTIFYINDIIDSAVPISSGIYIYNNGNLKPLLNVYESYVSKYGNYLTYYHESNSYPNDLVILDKNNNEIVLKNSTDMRLYSYKNNFIFSADARHKYYKLTLGSNKIESFSEIYGDNTDVLRIVDPYNQLMPSYGGIFVGYRLRSDKILTIDPQPSRYDKPDSVRTYTLYQFQENKLDTLAHSNNPLDLFVPEIKNYYESFIIGNKLYLHNVSSGESKLLGVTKIKYIKPGVLIPFVDLNKTLSLFDASTNKIYFDINKYSGNLPIEVYRIDDDGIYYYEEQHNRKHGGYYSDFHFLTSKNDDQYLFEIFELRNTPEINIQIENISYSNNKLYITANPCSFVYNINTNNIENIYTRVPKTYEKIIQLVPWGNDLYVFEDNSRFARD
jgi:hypothetical protein